MMSSRRGKLSLFLAKKKNDFFFSHPSYQTAESPVSGLSSQVLALQHTCSSGHL